MLRTVLTSKIHRARVTAADLDYVGSITIDTELLDAAGLAEGEKVSVVDVTNGARLDTYTIAGRAGGGDVEINGAAAHLVHPDDLVIIMAYGLADETEIRSHTPQIVHVDGQNRIVSRGSDASEPAEGTLRSDAVASAAPPVPATDAARSGDASEQSSHPARPGVPSTPSPTAPRRRVRTLDLQKATAEGRRWSMLTSYDRFSASIFDEAGVDALLVGDSAANTVFGYDSTLPVSVDELIPLARAVAQASTRSLVIADLPFGSYESSDQQAVATAVRFMKEAQVHAVKLEGGHRTASRVRAIVDAGIPVMAHIGFTPQAEHALGGYKVQGRGDAAEALHADARAVAEAGAFAVVLEMVPAALAAEVTQAMSIPTVGIGAGAKTDAQVLVWQDMAGLNPGRVPRFVRRYADLHGVLSDAARSYVADVEAGRFPEAERDFR